jgi:hypothetical protein
LAIGSASATVAGPSAAFDDSVAIGTGATASAAGEIAIGAAAHKVVIRGTTTTNGITNTGNISTGSFAATGDATVGGTLSVTGTTTLTGALAANGGVSTSTLATTGAATVGGTLAVTGTTTLSGAATVGGTLAVTGSTTLTGALTANGGISTSNLTTSTLTTTGDATVGGNLDMTNGQIRNLANGTAPGDAVNMGQLESTRKSLSHGIASTAAMANIPQVDTSKTFAMGVGVGSHGGQGAFAVGGSYRFNPTTVIRGSIAGGGTGKTSAGVGVGFSW